MTQTVQLKRSSVAGKVPATTDLALGEIAINTYDGKMFIKMDNGTQSIVQIGTGGGGGSTNLGESSNSSVVTLTSSTGTGTYIFGANATSAGVLTAEAQTISGPKTFSNTIIGSITGNANTATALQTARTINGVSFDGTANISITANTTNSLTINNSGTGAASGTTFNGGTSVTISYNTVGASPLAGSTSLTTLGTITTGTWNGGVISGTYGGTGVNNGTNTITLGGPLATSGAFSTTLTVTANTNITLPITGTLSTLAGSETLTNKTLSSVILTGTVTANSSVGSSGQVLTSSGTGVYWSTPTGGGGSTATYNTAIGDGTTTSFTITHSLNKANIFVSIRDQSTGYFVYPDIKYNSTNDVILEFVDAPTTSQYYVAVIGA
jgi:hypothetical protein